MSLPKCKDFTDYNKYPGEENPTTDAQMQEYMDNQNQLMKAASAMMWQPSSEYEVGDIVISPAMPANTEAVCVTAGMTDSVLEPSWEMGNNIPDGSCFWKLRYVHYTSFLATEEEAAAGTDTEKIMTPAQTKMAINNMNAASATKLETPRKINGVAFDGAKDITIVNTIEQGGTGATTAQDALINLGAFPSTGGIIEGAIQKGNTEEEFLLLGGTTLLNGSLLALRGGDYPDANGTFVLSARNSSGLMSDLVGYPDGGLFWTNMLLTHAGHIYAKGSSIPNEDIYLPSGGTWTGLWVYSVANNSSATTGAFYAAGGSHIQKLPSNLTAFSLFAIRVG